VKLENAVVLLLFLLAGCVTSDPPMPASQNHVEPPVLILVTNEEWLPIEGALVFLVGNTTNVTTDGSGIARIHSALPNVTARAWAPNHYRNEASKPRGPENETKIHIVLTPRPDDLRVMEDLPLEGLCYIGVGVPPPRNACFPTIDCALPQSTCPGPKHTVSIPIPEAFANVTATISWEPGPTGQDLVFKASLFPNGTFADGVEAISLQGPSPLTFGLDRNDLAPNMTLGHREIRIVSMIPDQQNDWGTAPVVFSQSFKVDVHLEQSFQSPPNPGW
jgi:hypothetical protein